MGESIAINATDAFRMIDELNRQAYLVRQGPPDEVREKISHVLDLAQRWNYRKGIGQAIRTLAAVETRKNPAEAYVLANQAIEILEECGDIEGIASALMSVFCYYHHVGWYQESLTVLQEAYEKATAVKNPYITSLALYNMGVNAEERDDFKVAIKYYEEAAAMASDGVNEHTFWNATNAYSKLNAINDPSDIWVSQLEMVRDNILRLDNAWGACDACKNIAQIHARHGRFREAIMEIRRARRIARSYGQISALIHSIFEHGEILVAAQRWRSALRCFRRVVQLSLEIRYPMFESRGLERMAFVQRELGLYSEALENLYVHLSLKESIMNEQSENRLRDLQAYHRLEIVQAEAHAAKEKNEELARMNAELEAALEQKEKMQKELVRLASTDELTGILNRRQVINNGILEMERFRHTGALFCVTLIDIDFFKRINDTFGHSAGDEVLRRFAKMLGEKLRKIDVFGRLGGEEFCVIHHDTELNGAITAVDRLLQEVRDLDLKDILQGQSISASMGICQVRADHATFYEVMHDADMALYEAKSSGRDNYKLNKSRTIQVA